VLEGHKSVEDEVARVVAAGNRAFYNSASAREYIDGAPHIKHASLKKLYARLVLDIFNVARTQTRIPRVLDLGAGEGSVTLPFLELGARVTAVDISQRQLNGLMKRAEEYGDRLTVRCEDVVGTTGAREGPDRYDIIVANSFLHHIPDYLTLIRNLLKHLTENGQFFSFQDPMRTDSIGRGTRLFSSVAYASWRLCKGDVWEGLRRRLRRRKGIYIQGDLHDETEYHVVRSGVDQEAIREMLKEQGFSCRVVRYFSTQSRLWQPAGDWLKMENTFAIIARKPKGASAPIESFPGLINSRH
jgi:SAM-dependent methyltransferase